MNVSIEMTVDEVNFLLNKLNVSVFNGLQEADLAVKTAQTLILARQSAEEIRNADKQIIEK